MTDKLWEFDAPNFIDFKSDLSGQAPSDSFFAKAESEYWSQVASSSASLKHELSDKTLSQTPVNHERDEMKHKTSTPRPRRATVKRKASESSDQQAAKRSKPTLTIPQTPSFMRNRRLSKSSLLKAKRRSGARDFVKTLRSAPANNRRMRNTVPVTPNLMRRVSVRTSIPSQEQREMEEVNKKFQASGVKHYTSFAPVLPRKFTISEPFAVEERSKQMLKKKDAKIQKFYEEERKARNFTAKPMLCEPDTPMPKKAIPSTVAEPFNFLTDTRGEIYKEKLRNKAICDEQSELQQRNFQARPILKAKFKVQPALKQLTEFKEFDLKTEKRSEARRSADVSRIQRQEEVNGLDAERQREQKRREEEELRSMRCGRVLRARPMPQYKTAQVKKSTVPLTIPITPKFSNRFKK